MEDIKKYLTVKEVAQKLGYTEEWVRDLIKEKQIKAVKIGRWRIKPEELENFIKSRTNL
jgi:excisionase family DNA binding protein